MKSSRSRLRLDLALAATLVLASARTASAVYATGGDVTHSGADTYHVFTNSGTLTVVSGGSVEVLVVAGGGGGGANGGGGGGAGGLIYSNAFPVIAGNYAVTVGAGGGVLPYNPSWTTSNGMGSAFGTLSATGGGGGASRDWGPQGSAGGSGGGGGGATAGPRDVAGSGTVGQGNNGGNGTPPDFSANAAGGGGGGAGGAGTAGAFQLAGNGGTGLQYTNFAAVGGSPAGWFAGGGGGGKTSVGSNGLGGTNGGGGNAFVAGTPNSGGGGGANAAGGSGVVIIKYDALNPVIVNQAPANVTATAATLNGDLISTGASPTTVSVYWGANDGGTVAGDWPHTNVFAGAQTVGPVSTNVDFGIVQGTHYYRFHAINAAGESWGSPAVVVVPANVTVLATDAYAKYGNPGVFTLSRPAAFSGGALTVNFTLGGTATNGVDYTLPGGSVVMADGASNATVTITPLLDAEAASESVTLTLVLGNYVIGSPSNATVTLAPWLEFTQAVVNVFSGTGNWNTPANWSLSRIPVDGDIVQIAGAVTLTNATPVLSLLALDSGTLTFAGWDTLLAAGSVTITNGAVTHAVNTDTIAANGWQPDSRVQIQATNVTLVAPGTINVDAKGYKGAPGWGTAGYGPGRGLGGNSGASHGGLGSGSTGGTYDSPDAPTEPGSGGGANDAPVAGAGGGVVRVVATENVTINGVISANGESVGNGGGGAGGSIAITCRTVSGTSGVVRANGGWLLGNPSYGGMGGGGRLAIVYDPAAQASMPTVTLKTAADRGIQTSSGAAASYGTINLTGPAALSATLDGNWNGIYYGITNWTTPSLAISSAAITFKEAGFALNVAGNILLTAAQFDITPTDLVCGGNLMITNNAALVVRSGLAHPVATNYGAFVTLAGDLVAAPGCWIYPYAHATSGASVQWQVQNLNVQAGAGINADAKGWAGGATGAAGSGLGRGNVFTGGGYGGLGGGAVFPFGQTYGDSNAPVYPGSGGGGGNTGVSGGAGGGAIRVEASQTITINGTLTANGTSGDEVYAASSGSGGGIYLVADIFAPAGGVIRANGAGATKPGGGGGRIALLARQDNFGGALSAAGAGSPAGGTGTVVRLLKSGLYSLSIEGSPARRGTPSPNPYGVNGITPDTWVTNSVASPADEANNIRYNTLGWTLATDTGIPITNDATTVAVFQVTTNVVLTWLWTNQFYLAAAANTNGVLQTPVAGWYTNGTLVTLTPVADGGHDFLMWSGTGVPAGAHRDNPLTVTMDQARVIQANFANQIPGERSWSGTGNWFSATNWSPAGVPGRQDGILIAAGTATIVDPAPMDAATLTIHGQLRAEAGAVLNVAADTLVSGAAAQLRLSNDVFLCGGDLVLTNGAALVVYSGPANAALAAYGDQSLTNYGALVSVGDRFVLAANSWVYPYAALQTKGAPLFRAQSLRIAVGAGFNADARGYQAGGDITGAAYGAPGFGPGRGGTTGPAYCGAGYGGLGGAAANPYGQIYGSSNAPVEQGSGGAGGWSGEFGGAGGGAIQLDIIDLFIFDGLLTANGGNGAPAGYTAAGGSGGGIYVRCARLFGNGTLRANGGDGSPWSNYFGKPGGGGRIAVWSAKPGSSPGAITAQANPGHVAGSGGSAAGPGTILWGQRVPPGTMLMFE